MQRALRQLVALAAGAAGLIASGCTIEDASDKRAADSAAAANQPAAGQTSMNPGAAQTAPAPGQTMAPGAGTTGAMDSSAMVAPGDGAPQAGAAPASATPTGGAPVAGAPGKGNLSPDSVDVGRKKADLLPLSSMRLEVDLSARQLHVYDGDRQVGTYRVAVARRSGLRRRASGM
jgi:hypothetical protein